MRETYDKIQRFLDACDELIGAKFNFAEKNITEILKAIAASRELTDLFSAVTDQLDYPAAKRAYLKFPADKSASHGAAYLPADRGEVLAFVFCLLVEFDEGSLRLNDFLLRYFYEDGSYTASFSLFAERMIRPFRNIVGECFPELRKSRTSPEKPESDELGAIGEKVAIERARISRLSLSEENGKAAEIILGELTAAAGRQDKNEIRALLCGYRYFLRNAGQESGCDSGLFTLIRE